MYCPTCGAKNEGTARFCQACGVALPAASAAAPSHLDSNGDGVPDALEAPTVYLGTAPAHAAANPTAVAHAAPTTVMEPPKTELDATRVAPYQAQGTHQAPYGYAPAPEPEPEPEPEKKGGRAILIVLLVAVVLACAGFGVMYWRSYQAEQQAAERARLEQEEAERKAAEEAAALEQKRLPHDVVLPLSAEGLDSSGTRIPVRCTGTDFEGNAIDRAGYLEADGSGIAVPKGSYEVVVLASPIAGDGTLYQIPKGSFTFQIPESQEAGSTFHAPGSLMLAPYEAGTAPTDVLNDALTYAYADPKVSDSLISELAEKAMASSVQAEHDAAVKKAQGDGLTVVSGTVLIMTGRELCAYQGYDYDQVFGTGPWVQDDAESTYIIIEFKHETALDCMSGDGSGIRTDTATMLAVTRQDRSAWEQYEGKEITVAFKPAETWWPSDVSLPMGQPRTPNVRIID